MTKVDEDVRRARMWGMTVLEKTEDSARDRYADLDHSGHRVDRWERIRIAYARLLLSQLDGDLSRLAAAATGCRAEYDYRRATESPRRRHEACRVGAELADAAAAMAHNTGLRPHSGREARDAVLRELQPYGEAGPIVRLRRRWALARDRRQRA